MENPESNAPSIRQLYHKLRSELDEYERQMQTLTPTEIMSRAKDYTIMKQIVETTILMAKTGPKTNQNIEALIASKTPLQDIFACFMQNSGTYVSAFINDQMNAAIMEQGRIARKKDFYAKLTEFYQAHNQQDCKITIRHNRDYSIHTVLQEIPVQNKACPSVMAIAKFDFANRKRTMCIDRIFINNTIYRNVDTMLSKLPTPQDFKTLIENLSEKDWKEIETSFTPNLCGLITDYFDNGKAGEIDDDKLTVILDTFGEKRTISITAKMILASTVSWPDYVKSWAKNIIKTYANTHLDFVKQDVDQDVQDWVEFNFEELNLFAADLIQYLNRKYTFEPNKMED